MPKNIFEDMIKTKNQIRKEASKVSSFDSVRPKSSSKEERFSREEKEEIDPKINSKREKVKIDNDYQFQESAYYRNSNFSDSKYGIWLLAFLALIFLFFSVSLLFVKATITVNPETRVLSVNDTFSAVKGNSQNGFSFDLVVLSGDESQTVLGGEEKLVTEPAKGNVIIYNNFSLSPQALDINTRLEGTNGKIYKTTEKVVVPGMVSQDTPGQVKVGIYSSENDPSYNSPPLDFKIVGFKGSPKYEKFFARSVDEITGGQNGVVREISQELKDTTIKDLETSLKEKLMEKAKSQIPAGFVLWPSAIFFEKVGEEFQVGDPKDLPEYKEGEGQEATKIVVKGVFYGFLFDEKTVNRELIKKGAPNEDEAKVYIANIQDMKFSLKNTENITAMNVNSIRNIDFTLTGNSLLVYRFNNVSFTSDIAGKDKKDFERIMSKYPNVLSAESSIKPIWKKSFPEDVGKIKVIVNYP